MAHTQGGQAVYLRSVLNIINFEVSQTYHKTCSLRDSSAQMSRWVKTLDARPDSMSLTHSSHTVEERADSPVFSDLHTHTPLPSK